MQAIKMKQNNEKLLTYSYSIFLTTIIVIFFILTSDNLFHPFIIPVYLTGIIIGFDLISWFRGEIDIFDPVGFIGIFGYHFFFLAPILQIYWETEMSYVTQPDNWKTWVLGMGIINLFGVIIYRISRRYFDKKNYKIPILVKKWKLNTRKLIIISVPTLIVMFLLQTYIYISFGGISGYVNSYTSGDDGFSGMGFLFTISESFPIILLIVIVQLIKDKKYSKNTILLIFIFVLFIILKFYFGGIRGSRANTLWGIVWAAGIIHLFIKRFTRKTILLGAVGLLLFIFIYGVYKGAREDFFDIVSTETTIVELAEESGRGIETVLLGDLSRTQTQSYVLYRIVHYPETYDLAYGRSYLGDLAILIPKRIYPERPPTKVKEGTEILKGKGSYNPKGYVSSRIYGLTGEFMFNFGYIFSPLIFIILGYLISKVRLFLYTLNKQDARLYLYPFLVVLCFLVLVQDLDNIIFNVIKNLSIPILILLFSKQSLEIDNKSYKSNLD